jgi:3D-(3,5/4)-trihydroxycyclohexane-1,2-dione acylhydrolase (decyclizing)
MRVLTDPAETGAVTVALPQDVQAHAYDYPAHFFEPRTWRIERRPPEPQRIAEAVALLKAAKRPVIIAGGGVPYSEAWDELLAVAETLGIPVTETSAGKGAMRQRFDYALGGCGVNGTTAGGQMLQQADLVLCVGTRLTDFTTGSQSIFGNPDVKFIGINIYGRDAHKQGALPIVADAREALRSLLSAARDASIRPDPAYQREIAAAREGWQRKIKEELAPDVPGEAMSEAHLIMTLNEAAQPGDTVITAAGGPPGDLLQLWDTSGGSNCHLEFGYSCMGYELPAGLGVRMAQREGEVYVFIGDGTYLMNPSELVTAMQENLKVTVVIADNHGYQIIRRLQMARAGRSFGNEFRARDGRSNRLEGDYLPIDFVKNAESFGARGWHVNTRDGLRNALREAREETRSCVIVAEIEKHRYLPGSGAWWDVAPAEVSSDPVTRDLRAEYEENRAKLQRFHY